MFVLDALIYIHENLDGSLAFRHSCRSRRCGSCAVLVDSTPVLACQTKIEKDIMVQPLPGFKVVKDLVVDIDPSDKKILKIIPSLHSRKESNELEVLPSDSVQKYIDATKCINCYICFSECPIFKEPSNNFAGPEVFEQLANRAYDPRDNGNRAKEANFLGVYQCTTCSQCKISCPKELSPYEMICDLRSIVIEKGETPPTIRDALESVYENGNPWGRIRSQRSNWLQNLNVKHISEDVDLLFFIGSTASYDPRIQEIAKSLVACLDKAGINFGVLKNEETDAGNEVFGMGEKGLFELLLEENKKIFDKYKIKEIMTLSPHSYNVFKNRYGKTNFEVQHYTQYIANLIEKGKYEFRGKLQKNITYQDPCYLGKHNGIYDSPRKIIENIPGVKFIELNKSRDRSVCCGGGGGRMWIDVPGQRLSDIRVKEAIDLGAEIFATACPFCLSTLEDSVKKGGFEEQIQVMDISEILKKVL